MPVERRYDAALALLGLQAWMISPEAGHSHEPAERAAKPRPQWPHQPLQPLLNKPLLRWVPVAAATPAPRRSMGPSANFAGPVDVPPRHQLFLAFDYGVKRTGVASGNRITQSASLLATIQASGEAQLLAVVKRVKEWQPDALVVGIPFHPDGVAHQNTKRARQFANQLRTRTKLVVYEVDERTAPPKPTRWALPMPMPRRPASFLNSFEEPAMAAVHPPPRQRPPTPAPGRDAAGHFAAGCRSHVCLTLLKAVRAWAATAPDGFRLVGITSSGAWLASSKPIWACPVRLV